MRKTIWVLVSEMLTGKAKVDYQRMYMRKRRLAAKGKIIETNILTEDVRPIKLDPVNVRPKLVRPEGISDDQWTMMQIRAENG